MILGATPCARITDTVQPFGKLASSASARRWSPVDMLHTARFVLIRRRTHGAGGFFGIERMSKGATRIVVGGAVVVMAGLSAWAAGRRKGFG